MAGSLQAAKDGWCGWLTLLLSIQPWMLSGLCTQQVEGVCKKCVSLGHRQRREVMAVESEISCQSGGARGRFSSSHRSSKGPNALLNDGGTVTASTWS